MSEANAVLDAPPRAEAEEETVPFFPVQFMREFWVALGIVGVFLVVAALWRVFGLELHDPADPMVTPEHIKPEWYFLALYQVLKFVPKTFGAVIPVALVGLLFVLPFLDRRKESDRRPTQFRLALTVVVGIVVVGLTIWGGM